MTPFGATVLFGPPTGVFGITSLTFTNFDGIAHNVTLFVTQSLPPSGLCAGDGSNATGDGSGPSTTLIVPPRSTLHLAYPMPMEVNPVQGIPCIVARVTTVFTGASLRIDVTGLVN